MIEKHLLPIEENKEPIQFANDQLKIFWLPDEIKVEKDIQDILTNFTEAEKNEIAALTLKLLPEYLRAFAEYRMLVFGAVMVLMMIFRPQGLINDMRRKYEYDTADGESDNGGK